MRRATWMPVLWSTLLIAVLLLVYTYVRSTSMRRDVLLADPNLLLRNRDLVSGPLRVGHKIYSRECAGCHGENARGSRQYGVPDLTDTNYVFGSGTVADIEWTVLYGIRSGNGKGHNLASMPAYAREVPYRLEPIPALQPDEIADLVQFVLAEKRRPHDATAAQRGADLYKNKGACYDCHGPDALGDSFIGAPSLATSVSSYGDKSTDTIYRSIAYGRAGVMPAFSTILSPFEAIAVAIYVANLHPPSPSGDVR